MHYTVVCNTMSNLMWYNILCCVIYSIILLLSLSYLLYSILMYTNYTVYSCILTIQYTLVYSLYSILMYADCLLLLVTGLERNARMLQISIDNILSSCFI